MWLLNEASMNPTPEIEETSSTGAESKRDRHLVERDLQKGYMSKEAAASEYGYHGG
jgi:N-methylhydantoinase B/oxoprolinase/acetone carboxylase alpha subunit